MQTKPKENPAVGTTGLDEEKGGRLISNPIVPPQPYEVNRRGSETMAAVLARVYRLVITANEGSNG